MAKNQFNFKVDVKLEMPAVKDVIDLKETKAAIRSALLTGTQKGAIYVQKDLRNVLNQSIEDVGAVDTGRLKRSLNIAMQFLPEKVNFSIAYRTPYANFVHYGGVMRPYNNPYARLRTIPGRPWVSSALSNLDVVTPFTRGVKEAWRAQFG